MHPFESRAVMFFLKHIVLGAVGAAVLTVVVLYFDLGGLRRLILATDAGWKYVALLWFGLFVLCGGVVTAGAVMAEGRDDPRS